MAAMLPLVHTPEEVRSERHPVADAAVDAAGPAAEVRINVRKDGACVAHRNSEPRAHL